MKVLKFGGGCLKDVKSIKKLPAIIKNYDQNIIIVISAFGKLTNLLEQAYETKNMNSVITFFINIMNDLSFSESTINDIIKTVNLSSSEAEVLSIGELTSSKILSCYFEKQNVEHTLLNATQIIKTNFQGIDCSVNWDETLSHFEKIKYALPLLTQGFIASFSNDENFDITCLGREGSDYSAAIFGSIFNVEEVVLYKDVDGIYSEDPKKNPEAKLFSNLTYDQAFKMSDNGNTIIHPKTIHPLKKKNIPILIKNFNNLNAPGTLIS